MLLWQGGEHGLSIQLSSKKRVEEMRSTDRPLANGHADAEAFGSRSEKDATTVFEEHCMAELSS